MRKFSRSFFLTWTAIHNSPARVFVRAPSTMAGKSKLPDPPKWGPSLAQFAIAVGAAVIIMNKKPF